MQKFNSSLMLSVLFHILVLALLIISFEFSSSMPVLENTDQNQHIINAVVADAPPVPKPTTSPPHPIQKEQPKPKPVEELKQPEPEPPKPNTEALQQIKKQQEIEVKKQQAIALKNLRKKQLAEQQAAMAKQLLDDMKKETVKEKKVKQKALADALQKQLKAEAAKSLQQEMLGEQKRVSSAKMQGIVNKYQALILQAIERRWLVPPGTNKSLSTLLMIRLAKDGSVLDVQVARSSGDVGLDRSARDAIFKASPLPVPEEVDAFEQFRQFSLKMKPEDLIDLG